MRSRREAMDSRKRTAEARPTMHTIERDEMTMASTTQQPVLVLGGTGKTGRWVVQRLEARGLPVRVGSRSGTPPFDWEDRATWAPVLDGVGSVYLTYYPDLAVPGAAAEIAEAAGREVRYAPVSLEQHAAEAAGHGV